MKALSAGGALVLALLPAQFTSRVEPVSATAAVPDPLTVVRGHVRRNTTLASLLQDTLSPTGIHELVEATRPVYDLARLSVGRPFGLALWSDGAVAAFTYGIDDLRTLRVTTSAGIYEAEILTRTYEVHAVAVGGTITSSLFGAVEEAGEEDQLALDLAEIFAWDVDFNTELQPGDSFRVALEKMYLDGSFSRYGNILAAELVRGSRLLRAVRFESDGRAGYYDPQGTPLRKAFLRSPLKFTRISSGFSRARFHPILKTTRPHLGVDYAAHPGTPVLAAADGVVKLAGWSGGYGKTVQLRHANGYETLYGHLSRINVHPGQRVSQGMVIGAVGTTGLSTGPHLDYRMLQRGVFLNPLRIQSPPADPVPVHERPAFERVRSEQLALLERASPLEKSAQVAAAP